jgi:DNA polymerase-3 subunit gamma/tau
MSYQVIARKYRPQRFADVVGQEHVTLTLAHAIEQHRIAHAYLFCGPRGTGKTTIARIFAKCLNATDGPKVDFNDDDPRCTEITEGRSLDVLEIDGASNRGIDEVRELRETVKYAPATARFKIYIVDEVHMLTKEAFNALLKTLEEPPAHVKFMFATTEPEKVLVTVLSRCQRFDLRRIPVALIVQHLAKIAQAEKVKIEEAALHAIARGADGGMRDAESALDQLISFCGEKIVETDVLSMFGLTAQGQILSLTTALLQGDAATVLRDLNELAKHGKDLGRLLSDLLGHFRNLLIHQVSGGDMKLLETSEAEKTAIAEQSARVSTDALTRVMEVLTDAEGRLRDSASKKIFVEVALLKAIQARHAISLDTVLAQLQQLRTEGGGKPPPAPAKAAAPAPATAPRPAESSRVVAAEAAPPGVATEVSDTRLDSLWRELLEAVGRASNFTRSYLLEAHPVSLAKNVFTIGFDPEFADKIDLVNNTRNHDLLRTKLKELGHPDVQIKFIKAERTAGPKPSAADPPPAATSAKPVMATGAPAPTPSATASTSKQKVEPEKISAEEFKNDPLIKKALEVFKGQIVEVRA